MCEYNLQSSSQPAVRGQEREGQKNKMHLLSQFLEHTFYSPSMKSVYVKVQTLPAISICQTGFYPL